MNWDNELIEQKIMEVANTFSPKRMPSRSEIEMYYGNSALTNKIAKTGGFAQWADSLGLEQKHSDTKTGIIAEKYVYELLKSKGFDVELTPWKYPYDIIANNCVKIDVKAAHKSYVRDNLCFMYRIEKEQPTCDFYAFCEMENDTVSNIYVVPAIMFSKQSMVGMGTITKKYKDYKDRFDLIQSAIIFYQKLCERN